MIWLIRFILSTICACMRIYAHTYTHSMRVCVRADTRSKSFAVVLMVLYFEGIKKIRFALVSYQPHEAILLVENFLITSHDSMKEFQMLL